MLQMPKREAVNFFSALYDGCSHIPGPYVDGDKNVRRWGAYGWCVRHMGDLATYDFDTLTRLVLLAHEWRLRAALSPAGPRRISISITRRDPSSTHVVMYHPTIDEAVARFAARKRPTPTMFPSCKTCGATIDRDERTLLGFLHVCPPEWACWVPDDAEEEATDAVVVYADDEEGAALKAVRQRYTGEEDELVERGDVLVHVRRKGEESVWPVRVYAEPSVRYRASVEKGA